MEEMCYLCTEEFTPHSVVLDNLCRCKGSIGKVHTACFQIYRQHPSYTGLCTLCLQPIQDPFADRKWKKNVQIVVLLLTRIVLIFLSGNFSLHLFHLLTNMVYQMSFQIPALFFLSNILVVICQCIDWFVLRRYDEDHDVEPEDPEDIAVPIVLPIAAPRDPLCFLVCSMLFNVICLFAASVVVDTTEKGYPKIQDLPFNGTPLWTNQPPLTVDAPFP